MKAADVAVQGHSKVRVLIELLILIGHLYLSDVGFGVDLRVDTKTTFVEKRLDSVLKI